MRTFTLFTIALLVLLSSCNYENPAVSTSENQFITDEPLTAVADTTYRSVIRSNNVTAGYVKIYNDNDYVYMHFIMNTGYRISKLKVSAHANCWCILLTNGCPNFNAFPYQITMPANTTSYMFKLTTGILPVNTNMYAAAYLELETTTNEPECLTAMVKGTRFPQCSSNTQWHFKHWIKEHKEE